MFKLGVILLLTCSCTHTNLSTEYYFGFVNKTGHDLGNVRAYFGDKLVALPGGLVRYGYKTEGPVTLAISKEAEVQWEDNGVHHAVKTALEGTVPSKFADGTLFFVINSNGTVLIRAVESGDENGYNEVMDGLRPKGEYRLGVVNKTGHDLGGVSVSYGDQKVGAIGDLLARVRVDYSDPLTLPIPAEAELRWTENSASHAVKAKLEGVPKGFEGRIFFVIKGDGNVEVHPVKKGDDKSAFELVK
ncbi:MAG TPA: hypothetical protein VMP11_14595 [Verrucomicrobiae bacterium]|nr:hypothetical protein [Verrucomicrobiae bacterium]